MLIHDAAAATSRAVTPEGFLRVTARIARAGVHTYRASELGVPDGFAPDATIRVYRPPEAVFAPDAMASFGGKPVTLDHPPGMIDARNWKHYAVGHSGPSVTRDGDHLAADLLITDADAVARAEAGAQLSNGYEADFDFTPGETPDGEAYDARQTNIRGNHIALVGAGRCGASCRISDAAATDCGCGGGTAGALTSVTIDGIAVETTTAGMAALDRLKLALEAKDGAIAALTAKVLDADAIDAIVVERCAAIEGARAVFGTGFDPTARSAADIRRSVASHLLGRSLDGRSDAYVQAAFDTLVATRAGPNPLARQLVHPTSDAGGREAARQGRDRFLTHAWKGDQPHGVS